MKFLAALFLAFLFLPSLANADQLKDGTSAYDHRDFKTALKLLQPLADQGNGEAQLQIGNMYAAGEGVKEDAVEAIKWFRKAADQGEDTAQFRLGMMYISGRGMHADTSEALKWLRKAAEKGNYRAQYQLGIIYQNGIDVKQDKTEAVKWLQKAADQGDGDAQHRLSEMKPDAELDNENCNPCDKPTVWNKYNVFELKESKPGQKDYVLWKGWFGEESQDIQIDVEAVGDKKTNKGKLFMVGGRVMATQGQIVEPGYEIDALDMPVLNLHIVMSVLGRALPNGAAEIHDHQKFDYKSDKAGIQFATRSAQGFIAAPWRATGDIKIIAPDVIEYSFTLTDPRKNRANDKIEKSVTNFAGQLSKRPNARLDDAMLLDRWNVLGLGIQKKKGKDGASYDYSAAPAENGYKTVADIRKKLAEDDDPGKPDPSKNFTGFWKSKCDELFGLQIMPYGTDGKYSVAFCGPGGCDKIEAVRKTFITGDKNFEVASEDELFEIRSSGEKDRKIRCTKDPHPHLTR